MNHDRAAGPDGRIQLSARSWVRHVPAWAPNPDKTFEALAGELAWRQEEIHLYGRTVAQPRLTAVCGRSMDPATRYRRRRADQPWTPTALSILLGVAAQVPQWEPNGLIANLYRGGGDSIGWHSDDEPALGPSPTVVSVSFGATRRFQLRPRSGGRRVVLDLSHGDLLVMGGDTQAEFMHAITKTKRVNEARLSLTFRQYR